MQGPAVASALSAAGIPAEAALVEEMEPIHFESSIRDYHRPLVGGLRVTWFDDDVHDDFGCTLGFGAVREGVRGFVTNSHCSSTHFAQDNTFYWQPKINEDVNRYVGHELVDPPPFDHARDSRCPRGHACRYSDANFVSSPASVGIERGSIARPPEDETSWDGTKFTIVAERYAVVGKKAVKVGKETGRSHGKVSAVCANFTLFNIYTYICQGSAPYNSERGDSGSPVFGPTRDDADSDLNVNLYGIHFASGGTKRYFSHISSVQSPATELGSLDTCADGYSC